MSRALLTRIYNLELDNQRLKNELQRRPTMPPGESWVEGVGGFRVCKRCALNRPLSDYAMCNITRRLADGTKKKYQYDRKQCRTCRRDINSTSARRCRARARAEEKAACVS